jgi:hypothetical protein
MKTSLYIIFLVCFSNHIFAKSETILLISPNKNTLDYRFIEKIEIKNADTTISVDITPLNQYIKIDKLYSKTYIINFICYNKNTITKTISIEKNKKYKINYPLITSFKKVQNQALIEKLDSVDKKDIFIIIYTNNNIHFYREEFFFYKDFIINDTIKLFGYTKQNYGIYDKEKNIDIIASPRYKSSYNKLILNLINSNSIIKYSKKTKKQNFSEAIIFIDNTYKIINFETSQTKSYIDLIEIIYNEFPDLKR